MAEQTVRQVMGVLRPPDVEAESWAYSIEQVAGTLGSQMVTLQETGLVLYLGERRERSFSSVMAAAMTGALSLEEIEAYVAAGRRGDPLGKEDFTPEDAAKSDRQIALNIQQAIAEGTTGRAAVIRRFLEERLGQKVAEVFPAILTAWVEVFAVRASDDWRRWVRGQVSQKT